MATRNDTSLTRDEILALVDYDPATGLLSRKGRGFKPSEAPRRRISLRGRFYFEHHVVWMIENGVWPAATIDHINGDPSDNRIENLRDVSIQINLQNQRRAHVSNKSSGMLGVSRRKNGKFDARIVYKGRNLHVGTFDSAELAHAAYVRAKRMLHVGCTI